MNAMKTLSLALSLSPYRDPILRPRPDLDDGRRGVQHRVVEGLGLVDDGDVLLVLGVCRRSGGGRGGIDARRRRGRRNSQG